MIWVSWASGKGTLRPYAAPSCLWEQAGVDRALLPVWAWPAGSWPPDTEQGRACFPMSFLHPEFCCCEQRIEHSSLLTGHVHQIMHNVPLRCKVRCIFLTVTFPALLGHFPPKLFARCVFSCMLSELLLSSHEGAPSATQCECGWKVPRW